MRIALRRQDDAEIRRRLALSLAITGQRAEALRVIEPQLRANDRAGWRTQAFILALTGDAAGADRTARSMMPGAADALSPFLQRLASLSPSQKALAVHFGHFPSDGRAQRYAQADSVADPGALAMARGNMPTGNAAPRRRPDADQSQLAAQIRPAPSRVANAAPRRQYSAPSFLGEASGEGGPSPQRYASAQSGGSQAPAWPTPVLDERQNAYPGRPASPPPSVPRPSPNQYQPQNDDRSPGFGLVPQGQPFGKPPETVQPQSRPPADFSIVTSAVNALEDESRGEIAPPVEDIAQPVRTQPARTTRNASAQPVQTASTRSSRTRPTPAQTNPSRAWVQVATGSNRAGLLFTYGQFRRRAPQLLNSRAAYTGPNRLLVGPFPTEAAAGSFARQLSASGVPSHSWTSDAGQRIDQLQAAASSDDTPTTTRTRTRTAATERSSGSRTGRNSSGARGGKERTAGAGNSRTERSAGTGSTRNRTGSGNSRAERSAGSSGRNGTGSSRSGRNAAVTTRTASAGTSRSGGGAGRSGTRNGSKPPARRLRSRISQRIHGPVADAVTPRTIGPAAARATPSSATATGSSIRSRSGACGTRPRSSSRRTAIITASA